MVLSCSLYHVVFRKTLEELHSMLNEVDYEEPFEALGAKFSLETAISNVHWGNNREALWGTLSFETVEYRRQMDGSRIPFKSSLASDFAFFLEENVLYLGVFANRGVAENSANKMSYVLTRKEIYTDNIVVLRYRISTNTIERILSSHPHIKKRCGWKDLDFPGVDASSLHGVDLDRFDQTSRFDEHGQKKYIMIEFLDLRQVVFISEQGMVTFYGNETPEQILRFIREEIFL